MGEFSVGTGLGDVGETAGPVGDGLVGVGDGLARRVVRVGVGVGVGVAVGVLSCEDDPPDEDDPFVVYGGRTSR